MTETGGRALRRWLLVAVSSLGETGRRAEVQSAVERLFGAEFRPEDRRPRSVRPANEPAWKNNLDSLYDHLKKIGYMERSVARDPWRLTDLGRAEAATFGYPAPVDDADLLRDFKPGDGSSYRSEIRSRLLEKHRDHEPLLRAFGESAARCGWKPITVGVHPRDLELVRGPSSWLVEAKVVYHSNATQAVRSAMAQLLEYRYYWYGDRAAPPRCLALFSESVGAAHIGLLQSLGIASVWSDPTGWKHDRGATLSDLLAGQA